MASHPVLALNTTRKTLLASRVQVVSRNRFSIAAPAVPVTPGDAIWIESCRQVDTRGMPSALDLLFLDEEHRVVELAPHVSPDDMSPLVDHAAGVLELPAGTISLTRTEVGDTLEIEAILAGGTPPRDETRCPRQS